MIEKTIDKLSSRTGRFAIDGMIVGAALYLAYLVRYDGRIPQFQQRQLLLWLVPIIIGCLVAQTVFGLHKHKWRYISAFDVIRVCEANAAFSFVLLCLRLVLPTPRHDLFRLPIGVIA